MRFAGGAAAVTVVAGTVACFDPHPLPGSPCSVDGRCPNGQQCQADVCVLEGGDVDAPLGPDAPPGTADAPPGAPDAISCTTWPAPNIVDPCALVPPGPLALTGPAWTIETDTGQVKHGATTLLPPSQLITLPGTSTMVRVFSLTALTIDTATDVELEGSVAAIFLVHGGATIDGALRASADAATPGAGAPESTGCTATGGGTGTDTGGGGGGGGGGFGKDGGDGARGADDSLGGNGGEKGVRGGQVGTPTLVALRAGCSGAGGAGPGGLGTLGGGGGGAFEISARDGLTITGVLAASGGGGGGGATHVGGGGGGSGGGILLEAKTLLIDDFATITANGGGGGGGGGLGSTGSPGADGREDSSTAPGGPGAVGGGGGGNGGRINNDSGQNASPGALLTGGGGGGGGGAVGRIHISARGTTTIGPGATISPAAN